MKKFIVEAAADLKTFTDQTYPQGSFAFAALLRARDIKVNGVRAAGNMPLKAGDEVVYYTTPAQEGKPSHNVLFEDENVLVCDKFSGVSFEALLCELNGTRPCLPVHRLDRNTCGVIVFAKNISAQDELLRAFKERLVHKSYFAICKNNFKCAHKVLTAYLNKDARSSTVTVKDSPVRGSVKIVTEYFVERSMGELALVKVVLHTGKTHQIRAHMAHIGCPLLGDEKYGDAALNKKYNARRQRLVSKSLSLSAVGALRYLNGVEFVSSFVPEV